MVSGYGLGALAALLGTRGVSGRMVVAAAVAGAAAGLTLGIVTIYPTEVFSVSVPGLLPKEVVRVYANPGT